MENMLVKGRSKGVEWKSAIEVSYTWEARQKTAKGLRIGYYK